MLLVINYLKMHDSSYIQKSKKEPEIMKRYHVTSNYSAGFPKN